MRLNDTIGSVLEQKGRVVRSVTPDQSVYAAIEEMTDKKVGALLVMSEGKLVGVIAERDYIRRLTLKGRCSAATQVKEIMTSPVIWVAQKCTVDECMTIMTNNRIRHLPVMEEREGGGHYLDRRLGEMGYPRGGAGYRAAGELYHRQISGLSTFISSTWRFHHPVPWAPISLSPHYS